MHLFHLFLFVMEKDWIRWKSAKKIISTREWCAEHPLLVKTHNTDFLNLQHSGKVILSFVLATNPKITIYYIKNVFFQEPKMSSETLNYKKIISKFLCKKCHWNEEILSYQGQQLCHLNLIDCIVDESYLFPTICVSICCSFFLLYWPLYFILLPPTPTVMYAWMFVVQKPCQTAPLWHHFVCRCRNEEMGYCREKWSCLKS